MTFGSFPARLQLLIVSATPDASRKPGRSAVNAQPGKQFKLAPILFTFRHLETCPACRTCGKTSCLFSALCSLEAALFHRRTYVFAFTADATSAPPNCSPLVILEARAFCAEGPMYMALCCLVNACQLGRHSD